MGLGSRGYVFTLVTTMLILIALSLAFFYTAISSPAYADVSNRMDLDELHYYVESLREDAGRAFAISGQRATAYAVNHVILTNETFDGYVMENCTSFRYHVDGVEAALAELMVCGTLENTVQPATDIRKYMRNNTVLDWTDRVDAVGYNVTVEFRNMSIALYEPWHYAIVSEIDLTVLDESSGNRYIGRGLPVTSIVSIEPLEDPMHYTTTGVPAAIHGFKRCPDTGVVNGSVLDDWIDSGCYLPSTTEYDAPSFFDRMEGRANLSSKFLDRAADTLFMVGDRPGNISLESLVNLDLLSEYNVSVNGNLSQVDYLYWSNVSSRCTVEGMTRHPGFRLDIEHATEYGVRGLNCLATVTHDGGTDLFIPPRMTVPVDTTVTWVEAAGVEHHLVAIGFGGDAWEGDRTLHAGSSFKWLFNETGTYTVVCADHDGDFHLDVVD